MEGNSARFGLVSVDAQTKKRTVKRSGEFYSRIIAAGGVNDEMYETYVNGQEYEIR